MLSKMLWPVRLWVASWLCPLPIPTVHVIDVQIPAAHVSEFSAEELEALRDVL